MLKAEGKYVGSALYKSRLSEKLSWSYASALFYSMSLFTTIGYGNLYCQTEAGKALSILYAVLGIPLMLMVLSDVGQLLLRGFTHLFNAVRRQCGWVLAGLDVVVFLMSVTFP